MLKLATYLLAFGLAAVTSVVQANVVINVHQTSDGKDIGTVTVEQNKYGLLFVPNLHDLPPGAHGFHIHQNPSCDNHGDAAGGHLDPHHTGKHLGPYNDHGHLGDLPVLVVNPDGSATIPVLAPRLKMADIKGHALMIHKGGDNYSDYPQKLGGGGARIACSVIAK
jgi:superoxide dismutase, Cu-Zn family